MKWTGHFDGQAMGPQIEIAEKTKAEMSKYFLLAGNHACFQNI